MFESPAISTLAGGIYAALRCCCGTRYEGNGGSSESLILTNLCEDEIALIDEPRKTFEPMRLIAAVMLTVDQREKALRCLRSWRGAEGPEFEILLWDNGSTNGTAATKARNWLIFLRKHSTRYQRLGFCAIGAPLQPVKVLERATRDRNLGAVRGGLRSLLNRNEP